jgi:histidine triad (HIT) family protein
MQRDPECIFCKVVAAQMPAFVVHEDQTTIAFLDVGPLAEGHLLLVPREHHTRLSDMPAQLAADLGSQLPQLGRALMKVTSASSFNVLCNEGADAGQVVRHVHFHLIPRRGSDHLGFRWNAGAYPAGRAAEISAAFQNAIVAHQS